MTPCESAREARLPINSGPVRSRRRSVDAMGTARAVDKVLWIKEGCHAEPTCDSVAATRAMRERLDAVGNISIDV